MKHLGELVGTEQITIAAASSVSGSVPAIPGAVSRAARVVAVRARTESLDALDSVGCHADGLLATTRGLLASTISADRDSLLASKVEGSATIYDKAMDAQNFAAFIGGGNHRMFDDGHTTSQSLPVRLRKIRRAPQRSALHVFGRDA